MGDIYILTVYKQEKGGFQIAIWRFQVGARGWFMLEHYLRLFEDPLSTLLVEPRIVSIEVHLSCFTAHLRQRHDVIALCTASPYKSSPG